MPATAGYFLLDDVQTLDYAGDSLTKPENSMTLYVDFEARNGAISVTGDRMLAICDKLRAAGIQFAMIDDSIYINPSVTTGGHTFSKVYVDGSWPNITPSPKLQALRNRLALAKTQRNKVLIRDLEKQIGAIPCN